MATPKTKAASKTETAAITGIPVLVTTDKKGVFFGYAEGDVTGDVITLKLARNCISWGSSIKGVFGLAAGGPDKNCRIGPAVPSMQLRGITSVSEVSPEAAAAWELAPWG